MTKIFNSEKELVDKFCYFFKQYKIEKEVETEYKTKTDLVLTINNIKIAFEAKLNNVIDVWIQALRNKKWYDYSYVILPENKLNVIMKNIDEFKKNQIGIILLNKTKYFFLNKIEKIL